MNLTYKETGTLSHKLEKYAIFIILLGLFVPVNLLLAKDDKRKPNVIVIFADDLGYGDLGSYGAKGYTAPHLDKMGQEGMRFTDFYVASSVCSASRAALLTGRYPIRTGVTGVIGSNTTHHLPLKEVTLAERFKAMGYSTALFGKWHLGNSKDVWPLKQGFDEWFGTVGSNDMGRGRPSQELRRAGKAGVELIKQDKLIEMNPDQRMLTTRYTDRAIDFIKRKKSDPFFLYVAHNMPHTPLFVSQKFKGKSKRGLFGDVIAEIDWSVGEILKTLKSEEIDEQTIVLFTSDNGPWLIYGDHGGSAGVLAGGKKQILEGGLRVPMIIRWPGKIPKGIVSKEIVSTLDITPTLLAMSGEPITSNDLDGRNMEKHFLGKDTIKRKDGVLFYFWKSQIRAVRAGRWKLQLAHVDAETPDVKAIGNGGLRGKVTKVTREKALYNLELDPGEKKNVLKKHPNKVKELELKIKEFQKSL